MPRLACLVCVLCLLVTLSANARAQENREETPDPLADPEAAIARSQAAIGNSLGDYAFLDRNGRSVRLADYRGKPLIVSLVFTACSQSCPLIVQRLAAAVGAAQEVVGDDGFTVATLGFDTESDTPARMRAYAREQGVDLPNWHFLSGDEASVNGLIEDLGFLRVASPRGFDHIAQISIVGPDGRVRSQVYGSDFDAPAVVEPLKALAMDEVSQSRSVEDLIERVRLFCTFYDPKSGRYALDYSIVISVTIGGLALLGIAFVLLRSFLGAGRPPGRAA